LFCIAAAAAAAETFLQARVRWNGPNLRWGNTNYLLEPRDLGYVNTAPVIGGGPTKNPALQIAP
jgi:hypothetical protein